MMRRAELQEGEAQNLARIETLTTEVKHHHLAATEADEEAARLAKKSTQLGKQTGLALLQLQKIVGYGRWGQWFEANKDKLGGFPTTPPPPPPPPHTARLYMQLAELPE